MALWGVVHHDRDVTRLFERMGQLFRGPCTHSISDRRNCAIAVKVKPAAAMTRDGCASSRDGVLHVGISGEIVNREELLASLPELDHLSPDDALLMAHLFDRYGAECIRKISGQFCAAVWDERASRLTLLLDRIGGVKCLYYVRMPGGLAFSSSLKSLLTLPEMRREINAPALSELFATGYIVPPSTLMAGISKVAPGEAVSFCPQGFSASTVDRISFTSPSVEGEPEELATRLGRAIARLSCEPETGFLLSGGIDSSVLVAMAAQRLGRSVPTFTAGFPGSPLDESPYAALVARANHCPNQAVAMSSSRSLDELPEIMWHLEEPFLDDSVIPTFHLFRQIRRTTPVVVGGDGPDHLFGRYYPLAAKCYVVRRYKAAIDLLSTLHISPLRDGWRSIASSRAPVPAAYRRIFSKPAWGAHGSELLARLIRMRPGWNSAEQSYMAGLLNRQAESLDEFIADVSALDFYVDGSFGVFAKVGKMAEANDLLLREPYMDREVSDYLAALPRTSKVKGNLVNLLKGRARTKYLLKYGLGARVLPRQVIDKRKGGFVPPLAVWLKEFLATNKIHDRLSDTLVEQGYVDTTALERMTTEHCEGIRDWSTVIFMTISLDLWVRLFIEHSISSFPGWKLLDVYGKSPAQADRAVAAAHEQEQEQQVSGLVK